jgi:hypothetical protein
LKALFFYLLLTLTTEISSILLANKGFTNFWTLNLFTILEFILVSLIYAYEFNIQKNKLFLLLVAAFIVTAAIQFSHDSSNSITLFIEGMILVTFSAVYFFKVFSDLKIPRLTNYYFFWLNSAFLIYFTVPFFLLLFENFVRTTDLSLAFLLWPIQLVTNISFNTLLSIGIWKIRQR